MFRDITIGQYYPTNSILHRLDPRVKLLGVLIYTAALFIINNIWGLIPLSIVLVILIAMSKVPLGYMLKGLRMVVVLLVVAVLCNLFFSTGNVLWKWWILKITDRGLIRALFFAMRLIFVILGASLLTYTTTPTVLTNGLESAMSPLKVIKFPAHEIAMMMSIALRFIPILSEEVGKIMKAQLARGAEFDTGGIVKKAKCLIPVLIPLFISAFRRAADLANAMESRCYNGGDGRTKMNPLKYEKRDIAGYVIQLVYLALIIAASILMKKYLTWGQI